MISGHQNFEIHLARRLANSALHAYDTAEEIKARSALPIYNQKFDLQLVIEDEPDCTIVSYRGTRSIENWKVDLTAIPTSEGIHKGFYDGFTALNANIIEALNLPSTTILGPNTFNRSKPLYIDGHSLGGGFALEAASLFLPDAVYTFGQPRVYTRRYIKRHKAVLASLNHWRIVDLEDIVTHVPGLLIGYRHIGQLGLISAFGDFEINPPMRRQLAGHIKGITADLCRVGTGHLPQWVMIRDHSMMKYVDALNNPQLKFK